MGKLRFFQKSSDGLRSFLVRPLPYSIGGLLAFGPKELPSLGGVHPYFSTEVGQGVVCGRFLPPGLSSFPFPWLSSCGSGGLHHYGLLLQELALLPVNLLRDRNGGVLGRPRAGGEELLHSGLANVPYVGEMKKVGMVRPMVCLQYLCFKYSVICVPPLRIYYIIRRSSRKWEPLLMNLTLGKSGFFPKSSHQLRLGFDVGIHILIHSSFGQEGHHLHPILLAWSFDTGYGLPVIIGISVCGVEHD